MDRVNGRRSLAERESASQAPAIQDVLRCELLGYKGRPPWRALADDSVGEEKSKSRRGEAVLFLSPAADQLRSTKEAKNEIDLRVPVIEATPPASSSLCAPFLCPAFGERAKAAPLSRLLSLRVYIII